MKRHMSLTVGLIATLLPLGCGGGGSSGNNGSASTASLTTATSTNGTTSTNTTGSNGTSSTTSTTVAPVTPINSTTSGSTTGTNPSLAPLAPTLVITSPARGAFLGTNTTTVQGTVSDPSGVASLVIQGQAVSVPSTGGSFSQTINLTAGINNIIATATNTLGTQAKVSLSVMEGVYLPATAPIPDGIVARLDQGAFNAVATLAEQQLGGPALAAQIIAMNPLYNNGVSIFGATLASATVNATSATFGNPTLTLTATSSGLNVSASIPNVVVNVSAACTAAGIPINLTGDISATTATVTATANVTLTNGVVGVTLSNTTCTLQGFNWGINNFPSILTSLASGLVQGLIQSTIASQLTSVVPPKIDQALQIVGQPVTVTILGQAVTLNYSLTSIAWDNAGCTLMSDANLDVAPMPGYTPLASPGSLVAGGSPPANVGPTPDFFLSAHEDFLNRIGFACWQAGVLDITMGTGGTFQLPAGLTITAGTIMGFVGQIPGVNANDPVDIVANLVLPPVVTALPAPQTLQVQLGELELTIYDMPPGAPGTAILTVCVDATVDATVDITGATNVITFNLGTVPTMDASVITAPSPSFDQAGLDALIQGALPPLLQIFANTWSGLPLPIPAIGVTVSNISVAQDGPSGTYLTVKGDL